MCACVYAYAESFNALKQRLGGACDVSVEYQQTITILTFEKKLSNDNNK